MTKLNKGDTGRILHVLTPRPVKGGASGGNWAVWITVASPIGDGTLKRGVSFFTKRSAQTYINDVVGGKITHKK